MRLLLIRHGETEHNVAGLLAGVTDSRLTNHGVTQTQRLGQHLVDKRKLTFSHVYASDLQRAQKTAQAVCDAQNRANKDEQLRPICLALLREQDFGSFELLPWNRTAEEREGDPKKEDADFQPKETSEAMKLRASTFIDDNLVPLFAMDGEMDLCVAVVSHGLFLAALWRTLLARFATNNISLAPDVYPPSAARPLEYLPSWTNTGILELLISTQTPAAAAAGEAQDTNMFARLRLRVMNVNCKKHLDNLKRTRGGVGSSAADGKQKSLEHFFKKPKTKN